MLLPIFLPLFNFLSLAIFGRFIGKTGAIYITLYNMLLLVFLNVKLLYFIWQFNTTYYITIKSWIRVLTLEVNWEFILDPLAVTMLVMVSMISIVVHVYSFSYMKNDPHFIRFISYLSLFTFFMFILVTASNFVQLFLGWEGVGICSYLLINFWFTRVQANKAAIKALLMNRVGDIGFLIGTVLTFALFQTLDFTVLTHLAIEKVIEQPYWLITEHFSLLYIDVICFFFFIGVIGKSAQLGLHTWLPAAMEGPTPVSALIHAATMVTAGIFLLIRCSFLFEISTNIRTLIIIVGAVTALVSALTAIFLYDIKKIIAYSTCSQLGYMAVACGFSQYSLGLFHLINHAFFKALLFLTAGAIIHSFNNEQDIRKLSGIATRMPLIHCAILIGNIAIMGLPFLSGFYSKDLIIEITYLQGFDIAQSFNLNFIFSIILVATVCTGVYSLRLYYYLFLRQGCVHSSTLLGPGPTQPFFIQLSLVFLMLGSIFSGYLLSDIFSTTMDFYTFGMNAENDNNSTFLENEFLPWYIKLAPLFCNLLVLFIFILFITWYQNGIIPQFTQVLVAHLSAENRAQFEKRYWFGSFYTTITYKFNTRFGGLIQLFQNNFYFNEVYNYLAFLNFNYYYHNIFINFDKGVLEFFGPVGLSRLYYWVTTHSVVVYKRSLTSQLIFIYNTILVYFYILEYFFM